MNEFNEFEDNDVILAGLGEIDMDDMDDFEDYDDDELSGRRRSRGYSRVRRARKAIRSEQGASRFRRHFLDRLHLLPGHIQSALAKGKAQISDAPYYSTSEMRGTRSELIKLSTPEELGLTNIDNGKLNKDRYLTLSGIRLLFDKDAINGSFTDTFPAGLLNGEWEMSLNGQKIFEKQPVRRFFDGFYGYNSDKPFGLYVLNNPKIIAPQTPIEFNINLPEEVQGYLKLFLEGTSVYGN
ncbi:hypothetical protein NBT05_12400 [Aquimarina sp. ERC-38]|uniref:hypothetical protein n=1 Tax=Aquimarina sp. ERC-38 TaxID=2949996 RepID=UPI0022455C62|nr:hypothetical protein [Aquimarina sp. ERC-38]UZO79749.1 hypothetical protein NBT05_12400 [Aquimarina sp. ERC-38]